jgi:hypothetical protein
VTDAKSTIVMIAAIPMISSSCTVLATSAPNRTGVIAAGTYRRRDGSRRSHHLGGARCPANGGFLTALVFILA